VVQPLQFVRLRVSGFKSFCDVTELEIGPGLTGIVGPNGCGKSNVVEALRWVMGESSAKGLRGGEMEDVIFGGSALRAPYDLAEVALGLKRPPVAAADAAIHLLPNSEDIEISRRIGRGTGSLYRLNGREVRQRDIQLLFADAGAGSKSPAIVGQGQVGFIVEAKPEERRRLLEEAAGIGGMHSRRREAELKLQATTANLERVTDQLELLGSRRTALEKQAREAERYKKLQAQIRALEAFLIRARIGAGRQALEAAVEALVTARRSLVERSGEAETAERAHAAGTSRLPALRDAAAVAAALLARLAERHERQAEAEAQRRAAVERLAHDSDDTRDRLLALVQAIEAGGARRTAIAAAEAELALRLDALRAEQTASGPAADEARSTRDRLDMEARQAAAEAAAIERRLEAARARHDERHKRLRAVQEELARLGEVADDALVEAAARKHEAADATVATATARTADTRRARDAAAEPLPDLRDARDRAAGRVQDESRRLAALEGEAERRHTIIAGHAERRKWHERALQQLATEADRLAAEAAALDADAPEDAGAAEAALEDMRARATALAGMMETAEAQVRDARAPVEGSSAALAALMSERLKLEAEAEALASLAEPVETTPVLDALAVTPGLETALVAALGDDLMAGTQPTATAHWQGRPSTTTPAALPGVARPLGQFVKGVPALERRLAQVGVVADAATAAALQPSLAQGQRLVTRDGGLWRWDGFVRGVEADDPVARKLAQRQRAQAIAERLGGLAERQPGLEAALAQAQEALAAAMATLETLTAEGASLAPRIERAALAVEAAREQAERRATERGRIADAQARLARESGEHETAIETIDRALAEARATEREGAVDEARAALGRAEAEVAASQTALEAAETALATAEAALRAAETEERQAVQDALAARLLFERRAGEAELRKAHRLDAASGLTGEAERLSAELETLDDAIATDTEALAAAAATLTGLQATLAEAASRAEELRGRKLAIAAELENGTARLQALAEEGAHLEADLRQRQQEHEAAAARLEALTAEHDRQAAALDESAGGELARELADAERASAETVAALAVAEAELERLAGERRWAEAGLAKAREAVALAEAEVERQRETQAELERETTRRLGQPIEAVLAAVDDPEITQALASEPPAALEARLDKLKASRERLGAVNLRAAIECAEIATEIARLENEAAEIETAVERLRRAIATLDREARTRLESIFEDVDRHFRQLFQRLFGGGKAHLRLTNMDDPLNAGLELEAMPPGKKLQNIRLLSGGEKSLTALALVFAFFLTQPSPLCVLDEVDAALDDANVERFADLLEEMAKETRTRFLVVTHHPLTMARMNRLFGVTMAERGVSKLVSVAFDEAERFKESA
jgi:chromosome segregation protein